MAQPTAYEQYFLELVNRARANPGAEASRLGLDLNQGLAAGTIAGTAKQPLAMNQLLNDSAQAHSDWMLATDTFSHTGANGSSAGDRMKAPATASPEAGRGARTSRSAGAAASPSPPRSSRASTTACSKAPATARTS